MGLLQTPEAEFEDLPDFDYDPEYVQVGEPRMAYLDEGSGDETFLCLHGEPTWSYLYRKMISGLSEVGRVVVPDFVGFGRSDKYEDPDAYTYSGFYDWLTNFVEALDLRNMTLVCQDWGGLLGLPFAVNNPERFSCLVIMNTGLADGTQEMSDEWWEFHDFVKEAEDLPIGMFIQEATATELSDDVLRGYQAPFPEPRYQAAAKAWPLLVPTDPDMDGAETMGEALDKLADWTKPAFVLFGDSDPITRKARDPLRELIPTASEQPDVWVEGAGHFLQEDAGEAIAERIVSFVERTST
ncbi:MAG: haloalkane dehalogenase [bacterium]